jgi:hypothetical protein
VRGRVGSAVYEFVPDERRADGVGNTDFKHLTEFLNTANEFEPSFRLILSRLLFVRDLGNSAQFFYGLFGGGRE